jgi:hypothetical protein
VKQFLKNLLFSIAPRQMAIIQSVRARRHSQRLIRDWGIRELNNELAEKLGKEVQRGPFTGLKIPDRAFEENLVPVILGTVESELHPVWDEIKSYDFCQVIDVGCKWGYYAVGFAKVFSMAKIIAFDIDPWARKVTRETAELNKVDNLEILGFCDKKWLKKNLLPNSFVISDCEGFEAVLFKESLGVFKSCTFVIEVHEKISPGVSENLKETFRDTHEITVIKSMQGPVEFMDWSFPGKEKFESAAREVREPMEWYYCKPFGVLDRR